MKIVQHKKERKAAATKKRKLIKDIVRYVAQ